MREVASPLHGHAETIAGTVPFQVLLHSLDLRPELLKKLEMFTGAAYSPYRFSERPHRLGDSFQLSDEFPLEPKAFVEAANAFRDMFAWFMGVVPNAKNE
jgi:hypothetical protein